MLKKGLLLFAVLLVVGCGGGGGGEGGGAPAPVVPDETILKVVSVSPEDGVIDIAVNAVISATLDEDIDSASVDSADFSVAQGESVAGWISVSGKKVSFTPEKDLSVFSTCVVMLSGLKSKSGKALAEPFVWSFTTGDAPDTEAPTAPIGLTATAISQSQINLVWTASKDNVAVAGYKIIRDGTQIGTSTATSYIDTGLTAETTYSYTASAYDASGNNSDQSGAVTATTMAAPVVTTVNLATADWVSYSKGGSAQATFDKVAGKVTVNIAGEYASDVSVRWSPLIIDKTKTYHVSFSCTSVPQKNVELQLKENGGLYHPYSTVSKACIGTVSFDMPIPDGDDSAGRLNINFGAAAGVYTIGTVTVTY